MIHSESNVIKSLIFECPVDAKVGVILYRLKYFLRIKHTNVPKDFAKMTYRNHRIKISINTFCRYLTSQYRDEWSLFDCTTFVWKFLTCMEISCTCFRLRPSPYSYNLCRESVATAVGTILTSLTLARFGPRPTT